MPRRRPPSTSLALVLVVFTVQSAVAQRRDTLRLSVQSAVSQALSNSDEARISDAQVGVTEAQVAAARAATLPAARLTSTYTHAYENARAQAVGQVFNQPNTYNTSINLTQPLFQGGRLLGTKHVAENSRDAARFDARETRARISLDAQRAYLQVLYTQRVAVLQDTNLALATSRVAQIEQLQAAGRAARYDVLRAHVDRANIEPLVIQARNDRENALLDLKRQLNIPLNQPLVLTSGIDPAWLRRSIAALVDTTAVADRASIYSAEATLRAREDAVSVSRADYYPTLSLSLAQGYQAFPLPGFGFPSRFGALDAESCVPQTAGKLCQNGGWFSDRTLVATASWPIFDGFRTHANTDVARAQAQVADLQLRQQREVVSLDDSRARTELTRSLAVFDARQ